MATSCIHVIINVFFFNFTYIEKLIKFCVIHRYLNGNVIFLYSRMWIREMGGVVVMGIWQAHGSFVIHCCLAHCDNACIYELVIVNISF